jgi:hypothetical protein
MKNDQWQMEVLSPLTFPAFICYLCFLRNLRINCFEFFLPRKRPGMKNALSVGGFLKVAWPGHQKLRNKEISRDKASYFRIPQSTFRI